MTVLDLYETTRRRYPQRTALRTRDVSWTWEELDRRVQTLASQLREEGVGPGTRVGIDLDNTAGAVVAIWASLRLGAAFTCLDVQAPPERWRELLLDLEPHLLLTRPTRLRACGSAPHAVITRLMEEDPDGVVSGVPCVRMEGTSPASRLPVAEVELSAPANLVYTSGSTGRPKAIVMSHRAMGAAVEAIAEYLSLSHDDIVLDLLPLSFDYGLYQVFLCGATGAALVLREGFGYPGTVLQLLRDERVTTLPGVPSLFRMLLRGSSFDHRGLPELRRLTNTGGHLGVGAVRAIRSRFAHAELFLMYGLSECKRVSYLPPHLVDAHPDAVGVPMRGCEVEIVTDAGRPVAAGAIGELVVRGDNLMSGYWRRPEATARALRPGPWADGPCLWTGDLFRRGEDGLLRFLARGDDVFKSRGEKVAPAEIESVLLEHPGVVDAAVVGIADEILDSSIHAFVVLEARQEPTPQLLRAHCAAHLERRKLPHRVHVLDELPRTTNGKVDRARLRRWAGEGVVPTTEEP